MKKLKSLWTFSALLLYSVITHGQTYVSAPMTSTPVAGSYYSNSSIVLNPNFSFTASSGQSLRLYIANSDSVSLGTYHTLGFVQQENIRVPGITTDAQTYPLSDIQKQTSRSYVDGAGRVVQSIGVQASPLQNDLIQPYAYDNLGRQAIGYLPYAGKSTDIMGMFRSNATSVNQPAFYNNTSQYLIATDANPYTQQVFENSPLQRMLKAGTVGNNFQPVIGQHYKTISYRFNKSTDGNIPIWNADGTFTTGNYYAANVLSVTDGIDEDNTEALSFTDETGHLILKRQILASGNLDTYYIYNWSGMLSFIVPPRAVALMAGTYSLSATGVNKLIFKFVYDTMGRLTEKTVPAKGMMTIVYDPLNRPVLLQDSNMRFNHNWNYIKYDVKGRAISQGIYNDATHVTRTSMQAYVSGLNYSTTWYENRSATSSTTGYYTNAIFPTTGTTPLAYSYYDDYDLKQTGSANYSYATQGLSGEIGATTAQVKGASTMVWKTTVGSGVTAGTWLLKVIFYDKRGNPIQTQSNNHVYYVNSTTLTDTTTMVPDFVGVPQISKVKKQSGAGTSIKVQTNLTYDHMYRVKAVDQYYNGSSNVTHIASYTYNEMGQVIKKSLGYVNSTTWLQNVDMRYNIRGQLLSINNSKLSSDTGKTNSDTNDLFGMQMLYDKQDSKLSNTPYYNGKLSAVKWMSRDGSNNSSYERAFSYYYDAMNRDTAAIYAERPTISTTAFSITHGWDENRITYDQNGNIQTLYRNSAAQGTGNHTVIDNLTYTYSTSNPNQLLSVLDASGSSQGFVGGSGTYTYDGNGNLTNEPYKGLSSIAYNVLNRTDKISFTSSANRYTDYTYDAGGSVIRKRQYDNVGGALALQNTTDYVDGFVYITISGTQTLSYFSMPEGRVVNSLGTLSQEYIISDQQGNARISFNNTGTGGAAKVVQENSYYAFGLIMPGSVVATTPTANKLLYNGGSEWQNDYQNLPDYYQTFNRNYDAALGRWIGVDPVAESAESMTSYQYAGNNPVMFNDPLGDLLPMPGAHTSPGGSWKPFGGSTGPLDNNWQNSGAFDDNSPFSDDHGAAGAAFWAPAENSGGGGGFTVHSYDGEAAVKAGAAYLDKFNAWGQNGFASRESLTSANGGYYFSYQTQGYDYSAHDSNGNPAVKINYHSVYLSTGNQGGYVGFKQFADLVISESSTKADAAGIAGVLISRMNSVGTSLNDPNWVAKIGTKSAYNGFTNGIYKKVDKMSIDAISSSDAYGGRFAGILEAFNNWGTDYSGMPGHTAYYWTAKGLTSGYAYDQWVAGNMVRNTIDGTTFYAFKVSTWQWTP